MGAPSPRSPLVASVRDASLLLCLAVAPFALLLALLGASFALPEGLLLFALAGPVVLCHILKPRRARKTVASVLLWREVVTSLEARHPFQRLRRNLPLFLELLALAALSVALARPLVPWAGSGWGRDLVLVLDASASMKTRDGPNGETRFELARREALELVRGLRAGERALAIAATPRGARTIQGWTDDASALDQALSKLEPSDGGAELGEALILAATAARPLLERCEVVLLSDGGGPPPPPLDFRGKLRYRPIGSTEENVGIVAVDLRETDDEADASGARRVEILASVLNAGSRARKVWVELRPPGSEAPLAARRLDLAPRSRGATVLEARLAPGAVRVHLSPAPGDPEAGRPLDLFPVDDEAFVRVPAPEDALVAFVGRDDEPEGPGRSPVRKSAIVRALEACPQVRVERRGPKALDDPRIRLVVLDGILPERLPRTTCLVLGPPPGKVGPVEVGETTPSPAISAWDADDRILRYVDFRDVEIAKARRLSLGAGARSLVQADRLPLVASFGDGDAKRIVLAFDVAESNWPLRLSFPIFVRNCVLAALEDDALGPRGTVRAGSTVSLRAPRGAGTVRVVGPSSRETRLSVEDGRALFSSTDEAGLYRVQAGDLETSFAVATLNEAETTVAPRPVLTVGSEAIPGQQSRAAGQREVVLPFVLVALAAVLLEGFAFHRRW